MDYLKYTSSLDKNMIKTQCAYCGSYVLSYSEEAFCHFCEGHVSKTESNNDQTYQSIISIRNLISTKHTSEAISAADSLSIKQTSPRVLFGLANIYRTLSNHIYFDTNYNLDGFMYKNSDNIYLSLDLISKSKEMFYKHIKLSVETDPISTFTLFISNLKLERMIYAKKLLEKLVNVPGLISNYATMAYSAENKLKQADTSALKMIDSSTNSLYYLSKCLINMNKREEAEKILERLTTTIDMPDAFYLLLKLRRLKDETKI
ncbi:MAG: hypothetical protein M1122_01680 [Candidatus Marsarchaeota archaeon]|nr:hypothetical protein [Candidatus Marsarchaeota archaeon]